MTALTDEDVADLKSALRVETPGVYKGEYSLTAASAPVARVLSRHGHAVTVDGRTGHITVTPYR